MNTNMNRGNGSGDKLLDWIFIIAAIVLFFKTADLLAYFSPSNINMAIGMDISMIYGAISAILVEGALLALHFNPRARVHTPAVIAMWILIAISLTAQVLDGFITTGNQANMSDTLKFALQFLVPMVPMIVLILLAAVGRLPDDGTPKAPFKGIKNIVVPAAKRLWDGDTENGSEPANGQDQSNGNSYRPRKATRMRYQKDKK